MEKTRIGLVISVILIVVLAAANVWFYTVQQNQIEALNEDKSSLQNQIESMKDELNDLQTYVTTHSHTDSEYDALTKQKTQLETWLAENMTYLDSLESQLTFYQNQTSSQNAQIADLQSQISSLNAQIANLASQIALLQISQNQISYQNFLNAYSYNRTDNPAPFYEQNFNMLFVDNSGNVLGSLAGDLRVSRISETQIHVALIFSFLGMSDDTFNVENVTVTMSFSKIIVVAYPPPPPPMGWPYEHDDQVLRSGECVVFVEQTDSFLLSTHEFLFRLYIDSVVLCSSEGKTWKSEETLELEIFRFWRELSEMEGKTETETFTVIVHEVAP